MTPKAIATKLKTNKWDYIKHKNLFTTKQIINKMEMEENLQIMNLIRGYSPKHIKNSDNSIARKKQNKKSKQHPPQKKTTPSTSLKNGQRT